MIDTIYILLIILILLNIVFFFLGYFIGRLNSSQAIVESQPISFFNKSKSDNDKMINKITIDESKYVTDIKTSGMEKKYENLGETKVSEENIESSINKLKNIKR
jgi:hypothetical protein